MFCIRRRNAKGRQLRFHFLLVRRQQYHAFSKTHTASSYEMTGVNRSNPPGGLFDKLAFRCVGMNASLDGKVSGTTVCEGTDFDVR